MLHTSVKLHTWNVIIVYHVSRYVCHSGLQSIVPQWYSFSNIVRGYFGICFLGILMCIAAYPHWNVFSVIKHLPSLCPSTQTPSSPSTWHQHEVLQLSIVMEETMQKMQDFYRWHSDVWFFFPERVLICILECFPFQVKSGIGNVCIY